MQEGEQITIQVRTNLDDSQEISLEVNENEEIYESICKDLLNHNIDCEKMSNVEIYFGGEPLDKGDETFYDRGIEDGARLVVNMIPLRKRASVIQVLDDIIELNTEADIEEITEDKLCEKMEGVSLCKTKSIRKENFGMTINEKCSWHDKDFKFECKPPLDDLPKQVEYIETLPQPEQRTQAWFEMRDKRVTASVAGAIVGMNPHQSRDDTLRDKLGLGKPFNGFVATEHGTRMEEIATMLYEQSKILDGEKPTDPALFSKSLIDTIYSSLD